MKFIGAYVRVSTGEQTTNLQRDAIQRFADAREATPIWYEDQISGATRSRPALDRLIRDVRTHKVQHVVVYKLDRLGRSTIHLLETLQEFRERKTAFTSLTEAIDTETPAGRALFGMLGVFAEFERDIIRERIAAGLAAARRRGSRLGRRPALTRGQVERASEQLASGVSIRQIAAGLAVERSTLRRHLAKIIQADSAE